MSSFSFMMALVSGIMLIGMTVNYVKGYFEDRNVVKSWKKLQKLGGIKIISVKEIGECSKTEVIISLENNSDRQITFKEPNVIAFDKEGFLFNNWLGTKFENDLPRNSKTRIALVFMTNGHAIDKIRIWDHEIHVIPDMFTYESVVNN
jgi:hypothetical protein